MAVATTMATKKHLTTATVLSVTATKA
jgi:hypothetical protein